MTTTLTSRSNAIVRCMVAGLTALLVGGTALAAAEEVVEEIVVTAQKREQNIQTVPIAITAFTSETLTSKGITDLSKLTSLTPNVNLDSSSPFSGDSSVLSASIRGIGQDDFAFNLDPGVGVYLDGVYLARTIGANQNLMDVDRIEVLKGPQGTLFGRNTIGGAIAIYTHTPGTERTFKAQATTGRYSRRDFSFSGDIPITDKLLSTFSVSSSEREGYQRVIPYPANSPYGTTPFVVDGINSYPKAGFDTATTRGGQNVQVMRGKLLWKASDAFQMTLAADWTHQDQPSTPATILTLTQGALFGDIYRFCISNTAATLNALTLDNGPDIGFVTAAIPEFPVLGQSNPIFNTTDGLCGPRAAGTGLPNATGGAPLGGAGYVSGAGSLLLSSSPRILWDNASVNTGNIDTTYANGVSFARNDAFGFSVNADWSLSDSMAFKSITGYRQIAWKVGIDLDGTPEQLQEVTDAQHQYQVSQEFQLTGQAFDNKLNYVGGLYFFKEAGYVHDFVPFEGLLYVYDYQNDVDTKSYAGFFHTDYKFTDRFSITLGARYSTDKKKFIGGQGDLDGFSYKLFGCPPTAAPDPIPVFGGVPNPGGITCQQFLGFPDPSNPLRYFPPDQQSQTFNVFTPKFGFQVQATDDVMIYANWSKGFKSGGWTTRLSQPILDGADAEFGPEIAKTTELGLKSEWLDRRLVLNAAVFYTKYQGIQLQVQQGASPVSQNAGDATIKGAELEMHAVAGNGFSLNFVGGYIDAKYDTINPDTLIPLDSKLPKTPKYKVTVGPAFEWSLAGGAKMQIGADYTRTASMFNDSLNTPELFRPATDNLNAAIHYLSPAEKYEVILGGTNLTDERYLTVGSINRAAGEMVGTYSRPREWYLTLKMKLGGE